MRQLLAQYVMTMVPQWLCFIVGLTLNSYTLILIVWPRSVVTVRVFSCGSVLVLQFQKAPNNSKLISSSSICYWQEVVLTCLACEYNRFSIIHFPHIEWMFPLNVPGGGCIRSLRIIGRSEKLRRIDWWQVSVLQDNPLSVLCFLPFLFIIFIYLFVYVFQFSFRAYKYSFTRGSNSDLFTRLENCGK